MNMKIKKETKTKTKTKTKKKKILLISSSPRTEGNSDLLVDSFMSGATESKHQVEKIQLSKYKINYCKGCEYCQKHSRCVQKDDADLIIKKMIDSDVIVMASPLYFYTITSQLKTLIDRCCAKYTKIKNKDFYLIFTAADEGNLIFRRAISCIEGLVTDCLSGCKIKKVIKAGGLWHKGEVKDTLYIDAAYKLGKGI